MFVHTKPESRTGAWNQHWSGLLLLGISSGLLLLSALLCYLVNPFGYYPTRLFKQVEPNYRRLQFEMVQQTAPPPAVLILGTSRVMTIPPGSVSRYLGLPCFNMGVPRSQGGYAEDYYAALRLMREQAKLPVQAVILGTEFEAFSSRMPVNYQTGWFPVYAEYLGLNGNKASRWDPMKYLLSWRQSVYAVKVLQRAARLKGKIIEITPDGQIVYLRNEREIADGTYNLERRIKADVQNHAARTLELFSTGGLDPQRRDFLVKFLKYCQEHNIKVYAYLAPYHPIAWEVIDSKPASTMLSRALAELQGIFADYGVKLHDFSRIEYFGGSAGDFYDVYHMRPTNQDRLLAALFGEG